MALLSLRLNSDPDTRNPDEVALAPAAPLFTLLACRPQKRRLAAFVSSALLHSGFISVGFLGFTSTTKTIVPPISGKYSVRLLQFGMPVPTRPLPASTAGASAPELTGLGPRGLPPFPQGEPGQSEAVRVSRFELPPPPQARPVQQTLVQPDVPPDTLLSYEVRTPEALVWNQNQAARPNFIAPPPREARKPEPAVNANPNLAPPNIEAHVADVRLLASIPNDQAVLARAPATTSPVRIPSAKPENQIPQTYSPDSNQKAVGNIVSVPDVPLPASGIIVVPPANQIAVIHNLGSESFGRDGGAGSSSGAGNSAGPGQGGTANAHRASTPESPATSVQEGRGNALSIASVSEKEPAGALGNASGRGAADSNGRVTGAVVPSAASSSDEGKGDGTVAKSAIPDAIRIDRPKDGRYSVVVLGSSASEAYPESVGLLTGKLVYTVYLRVGLQKNWILQYCLPRAIEQNSEVKGNATPLDAPWPFLMVRPDLPLASDRDYVIVHGSLSPAGRFEQLALILPDGFVGKKLLLNSLAQWEFRPATRDGLPVKVEVLLIIPRAASA